MRIRLNEFDKSHMYMKNRSGGLEPEFFIRYERTPRPEFDWLMPIAKGFAAMTEMSTWYYQKFVMRFLAQPGHTFVVNKATKVAGPRFYCQCGKWESRPGWTRRYARFMFERHTHE